MLCLLQLLGRSFVNSHFVAFKTKPYAHRFKNFRCCVLQSVGRIFVPAHLQEKKTNSQRFKIVMVRCNFDLLPTLPDLGHEYFIGLLMTQISYRENNLINTI